MSYQLREPHAQITNVETRTDSQRRLYRSGLGKLVDIKVIMENSNKFSAEAVGLADLCVADWKALFGKSAELSQDYGIVIRNLKHAGVSDKAIGEML